MNPDDYASKANDYLQKLCNVKPNRRTGSRGNRAATGFFLDTIRDFEYQYDGKIFECLDYTVGESRLSQADKSFEVYPSPYSEGCDLNVELVVVSSVKELENTRCDGQILLMQGEICAEQLMPKNFVFYNPEHHQQIIALLEERAPVGIITATVKNPDQVGALYPYPLIVDGDFDIPSLYCTELVGEQIAGRQGEEFNMRIEAERSMALGCNVIGRLNPKAAKKVVFTAHIDAYEDTPGASDNASGTVVLLLLAEMLADYQGELGIEIAALNGEDHYSAAGQMDYLKRYGETFEQILLAVNIDDVGYHEGRSAFSFYECPGQLEKRVEAVFSEYDGLMRGEPWYNGDHMIFVQNGVPSAAFTSECMPELMRTVTHTVKDTPDIIDTHKLIEVAEALNELARAL
jgi:aminopeptidase YwaD